MKSVNIILPVILLLLFIISCKHKAEEIPVNTLKITPASALLYEGDSVQLALLEDGKAVTQSIIWTTVSGNLSATGMFTAPDITTDTQHIVVSSRYAGRQLSTTLIVTKSAFRDPAVSFSQAILPVFVSNCNFSGCHGNGSRASKVELSCYDSVMNAVIPFAAINSRAYYSMIKTDPLRIMPPAGKLHQNKIDAVKNWIDQGAKNN